MAISRNGTQPATVGGPSKATDRYRQAVYDVESQVEANLLQQLPPQHGFDLPEVGRLTHIGRQLHAARLGKEVGTMAAKVGKGPSIGADAQEGAHDFNSQHFAVSQRGLWTALAQLSGTLLKPIVDESEYTHDECAKIHFGGLLNALAYLIPKREKVSFLISSPEPCTRG